MAWGGLVVVLSLFLIQVCSHLEYTPDDTYIYLQYARNIIQHHEMSFNAGEPSYGVTSPLWLGAISVAGWLGIDLLVAAKGIDICFALGALIAIFLIQRSWTASSLVALLTAAALSTHIWFLRWAGTGMETSLVALLVLLTVHNLVESRYQLAAVYSGLLVLVRPESVVVVTTAFLCALYLYERKGVRLRALSMFVPIAFGVVLPWLIYAYLNFGTVVPNTALAKSSAGYVLDDMLYTLNDSVKTLGVSDGLPLLILLTTCGLWLLKNTRARASFLRGRESKDIVFDKKASPFLVSIVWIVTVPILYVATSVNVISRYFILVSPIGLLVAFAMTWRFLETRVSDRYRRIAAIAFTFIMVSYNVGVFQLSVKPHLTEFSLGMKDCFIDIGEWLRKNTSEESSVLVGDIGAIGYYSNRKIYDAAGLISPALLPFVRKGYSIDQMLKDDKFNTICNPSYVIERSTVPDAVHASTLRLVLRREVHGLGLASRGTMYYSVYKVERN